jgi:hypothetical protein
MIDRNKGCALPACGHISGAHVIDDRHSQSFGQCLAVAELNCELYFGAVNDCLPVEADDINGCRVGLQKIFDRLHVPIGECGFRLGKARWPFVPSREVFAFLKGNAQNIALFVRVGIGLRWPALDDIFPVGANKRNINAIQRGA